MPAQLDIVLVHDVASTIKPRRRERSAGRRFHACGGCESPTESLNHDVDLRWHRVTLGKDWLTFGKLPSDFLRFKDPVPWLDQLEHPEARRLSSRSQRAVHGSGCAST